MSQPDLTTTVWRNREQFARHHFCAPAKRIRSFWRTTVAVGCRSGHTGYDRGFEGRNLRWSVEFELITHRFRSGIKDRSRYEIAVNSAFLRQPKPASISVASICH